MTTEDVADFLADKCGGSGGLHFEYYENYRCFHVVDGNGNRFMVEVTEES